MAQGFSGTYAVGGINILQPTTHKWADDDLVSYDGNGRPVYPAIKSYELGWQLMSHSDFQQLLSASLYSISTGTVVVDLPRWGNQNFVFYSYSGTYVNKPNYGGFFMEHYEDVSLTISNIRTE